jgi:hypothetical protein
VGEDISFSSLVSPKVFTYPHKIEALFRNKADTFSFAQRNRGEFIVSFSYSCATAPCVQMTIVNY